MLKKYWNQRRRKESSSMKRTISNTSFKTTVENGMKSFLTPKKEDINRTNRKSF